MFSGIPAPSKSKQDELWRLNLILVIIFLFGLVVLGRLFFIQVIKGDFYKALAQGQGLYSQGGEREMARGEIFFQNQEPLAINMEWPFVFASPVEIEKKEETARELAKILNLNPNLILEKFQEDSLYTLIKKRLTEAEINLLKEIDLNGIYLGKESGRFYPQETLASKLAGFLGQEKTGQYGLEGYYDEVLRGKKTIPGSDLFLTIDYSIQFQAEELLKQGKEKLEFESGQIIVIDPHSGKILALANYPNFNPNKYSEITDFDIFQNGALQKIFEPGSVFKPITMAAAINEGKITPQTTYQDPGEVRIGGYKVYNYEERQYPGDLTMTNVLEKSINTGAVWALQQLGSGPFLKYIEKFGIFEPTKIDLEETYSENKEFKKGYEINFATASFGQGIEMTPIQLIRAFSVIANGGKLVNPFIVEKIKDSNSVKEIQPEITNNLIISPKSSSQVTAMMVSVVENGFAKPAKIPGYYVAGKTGTAQISYSALKINKKGYSTKTWQSFMGFAPAFNPRFLILVKLDNPKTKTAEYSAVPIFHDLAKYIIDYWQIPPDYQE